MSIRSLVNKVSKSSITEELINRTSRDNRLLVRGGNRSTRALISSAIARNSGKPLCVVVPTIEEASRWNELLMSMGWEDCCLYPTSENSAYCEYDPINEITWGQLQVLANLKINPSNNIAIVTTERALQPHLPKKEEFYRWCIEILSKQQIDLENLSFLLAKNGYERLETTEREGTWSRRGDIIDIFPVSAELPVRIEFFGEEIERIREYDPLSQRTLDEIQYVVITPVGYGPIINEILTSKNIDIKTYIDKISDDDTYSKSFSGLQRYLGLAWDKPDCLLDFLEDNTYVIIDEPRHCESHSQKWFEHSEMQINEFTGEVNTNDLKLPKIRKNLHISFDDCINKVKKYNGYEMSELMEIDNHPNSFNLNGRSVSIYPNQFGKISAQIKELISNNNDIWIISAQPSRATTLLEEHDCSAKFVPNPNDEPAISRLIDEKIPIALKNIGISELEGFHLPAWNIVVITDKEFFGQHTLRSTGYIRKRRKSISKTIDPSKIMPGDFVVHKNHGIGQFKKMSKQLVGQQVRDYLLIQYLDGTLSVAADQLGSLGRYRAIGDKQPKLNKLGGRNWNTTKEKAKKAIRKIAIDLIKLYAEREKVVGHAFPEDGPWQKELEDSFPYVATPDQVKAITEVKKDMENNKPMDRLICGDVGYGKTEVAIRAIFKAITSGKQIALLAPTTILAQQHWRTLTDRFAPYPIKVAILNRYRTSKEVKSVLEGLKNGNVDAIVGTHQLLSDKISFKELGLLIVDEEQRFGVKQKEKIKLLRKNVDVLTLSATPIPRTLYMSISGVRKMSLITTPPPSRIAIKTHLSQYDDDLVRSAIRQEVDRGGQVFYVVPRISSIEEVLMKLNSMMLDVKILVAHGQMDKGELESAMVAFNSGEANLMLCTTIIESGLDIPRVNTIIIEDSQKMGLSQLYQLRGRVGRSGVQAHAWLLYPNTERLSDNAKQRLKAIQEFSQLGSGYHLAMRDMEIRGVGNILGMEQSGQLEAIGFELYMDLLQETMADLQGQDIPHVDDTQIDLKVTAFIPAEWISDNEQKIKAYKDASECTSKQELVDLAIIWSDRFGPIPNSVNTLLDVMELKLCSRTCGFSRIASDKQNLLIETKMDEPAFRMLRKAIPEHLKSRFIFSKKQGLNLITVRGLGVLDVDKQLEQLKDWVTIMAKSLIDSSTKNNT